MDVKTYGRRLLAPFHGMLQVVEVRGGAAETSDGRQWTLDVADEAIVSHAGLSEIQHGSWTANGGKACARVRGTCCSKLIEETGERLITALESHAARVPFPARDVHELWLLKQAGLRPDTRSWLERAAWGRPVATSNVFRLSHRVLDREGLRVARVKAQLLGGAPRAEGPASPSIPSIPSTSSDRRLR
jgi:hypothetical protein